MKITLFPHHPKFWRVFVVFVIEDPGCFPEFLNIACFGSIARSVLEPRDIMLHHVQLVCQIKQHKSKEKQM